jgi:hypothetical protein
LVPVIAELACENKELNYSTIVAAAATTTTAATATTAVFCVIQFAVVEQNVFCYFLCSVMYSHLKSSQIQFTVRSVSAETHKSLHPNTPKGLVLLYRR